MITVVDCGDRAEEWLAAVIGKELRLVCHLHIVQGLKESEKVKSDHGLVFKVYSDIKISFKYERKIDGPCRASNITT